MCGILFALGSLTKADCSKCIAALQARGPEGTAVKEIPGVGVIAFTRLAINGLSSAGMQPMVRDGSISVCNGEIYNWRELNKNYSLNCNSGSDCEVIGALYERYSMKPLPALASLFRLLDGVFATIIVDVIRGHIIIARDPFGVRPLYRGFRTFYDKDRVPETQLFFGSELKSLSPLCTHIEQVQPGSFQVYNIITGALIHSEFYHTIPADTLPYFAGLEESTAAVRAALKAAVKKRMLTERPCGALLSGGLDSSLIASLVAQELKKAGMPPLKTFSIGMEGSSDLAYAKKVAEWIGSDHHEVIVSPELFFASVPDVIKAIESYDTTTVRASVGNWLVAKTAAETECKVIFNGDGADELFGSYLYMFGAPDAASYEEEAKRLLKDIYLFDVQRSDRSISSHGLEPRTPFLDKHFVNTVLQVPVQYRRPTKKIPEKWILRRAFDDGETLPSEVLWRRKEAFSDGVSGDTPWYKLAQEMALKEIPSWADDTAQYIHNVPTTAEMYYYRTVFDQFYPSMGTILPYFWMPRWSDSKDPSARTLKNY
jgi:asparagine synthase (glutamine-hydrolysing)